MKNNFCYKKRIHELLLRYPQQVLTTDQIFNLYNLEYSEKMIKKQISPYINKLWKEEKVFRTKTQLKEGFYYSLQNRKEIDLLYKQHLLPYDFADEELLSLIEKHEFEKLKTEKINLEYFYPSEFLSEYNINYLKEKKVELFLARLVAFVMGDGHLKKSKEAIYFYFRHLLDAEEFVSDFKSIFCKHNIRIIKTTYCYSAVICSSSLAALLERLGAPVGNKVTQGFLIPNWIYHGSNDIKREFLSTIYGNEGSKPQYNRWRIQFVMSKNEFNIKYLLLFQNQIRAMLSHFNIESSHIQIRKQKGRNFYGRFYIKERHNLHKFYKLFKFYYAYEKQNYLYSLIIKGKSPCEV